MRAQGMRATSFERIVDPAGWVYRHNRHLVEMLTRSPELGGMLRQIVDQIDVWAGLRGIPTDRLGFEHRLTREGRVVVWAWDKATHKQPAAIASRPREVVLLDVRRKASSLFRRVAEWLFGSPRPVERKREKRFQARGEFLAVRQWDPETRRASGIIIPDTVAKEEPIGTVLSVGDEVTINVKVGDTVVLVPYAGTQIRIKADPEDENAQPFLIIPQSDIQGFIFDDDDPQYVRRADRSMPLVHENGDRAPERVTA